MSTSVPGPSIVAPSPTPIFANLYSTVTGNALLTCSNELDDDRARLTRIYDGYVIFQGTLEYAVCKELWFAYNYEIHIPLTDPLLKEKRVWQHISRSTYPQGVRFQFLGPRVHSIWRRRRMNISQEKAEDILRKRH